MSKLNRYAGRLLNFGLYIKCISVPIDFSAQKRFAKIESTISAQKRFAKIESTFSSRGGARKLNRLFPCWKGARKLKHAKHTNIIGGFAFWQKMEKTAFFGPIVTLETFVPNASSSLRYGHFDEKTIRSKPERPKFPPIFGPFFGQIMGPENKTVSIFTCHTLFYIGKI